MFLKLDVHTIILCFNLSNFWYSDNKEGEIKMDIELKKELPPYEEQQDFYEKLRSKITTYVESKTGKKGKLTPYLLFAPDLFHLLVKSLLDNRIDTKSKTIIGSGILIFYYTYRCSSRRTNWTRWIYR